LGGRKLKNKMKKINNTKAREEAGYSLMEAPKESKGGPASFNWTRGVVGDKTKDFIYLGKKKLSLTRTISARNREDDPHQVARNKTD